MNKEKGILKNINEVLNTLSLTKQRHEWRCSMLNGTWEDPHILKEYRKNRNSELWRASKQAEMLCEYILHLEALIPPTKGVK